MRAILRKVGAGVRATTFGVVAAIGAFAFQSDAEAQTCAQQIQGQIAWDYEGTTYWSEVNVHRLCGGRPNSSNGHPAACFQRVMHGGVSWGGGTRWRWENAIDLCEGVESAPHTFHCFRGQIAIGRHWRQAIDHCTQSGRALRPAEPFCDTLVQGLIAWDYSGSVQWSQGNIDRLCRGASNTNPASCFRQVMHGGVNWGGGTQWEWRNAIDLCEGSPDWRRTVGCFERQVASGAVWSQAIRACEQI